MTLNLILLLLGFMVIYFGAEWLVRGSANLAIIFGVSPVVIGLTVVAFGTSLPELVVSLIAALRESTDIALGNIIGSNIANIGLVLAAGAAFFTVKFQERVLRRDIPIMLLFSMALMLMGYDGIIGHIEGTALFAGLLVFTIHSIKTAKPDDAPDTIVEQNGEAPLQLGREIGFTVGGIIGVLMGAHMLVESAVSIARVMGVSELVIGITVIAVGTSLPELSTTVVAAYRKVSEIAIGNVIGSNIFNIAFVIGLTGMVKPLPVAPETWRNEMMIMLAFSVALLVPAFRRKMGHFAGAVFLAVYALFIGWMVVSGWGVG